MASAGTVAALVMYGAAKEPMLAMAASLVAGACWIVMMTTLFVSAQVALPEWVRGRGLAIFLTAFFGAMTLGSAIWGKIASVEGLPATFYIAAAGALLGMVVTWRRKLQRAASLDLSPSLHWNTPNLAPAGGRRSGAGAGHRRLQDRSEGQGAVPRCNAGNRPRAEA